MPAVLTMKAHATGVSARYFALPVYLVGSAITDPDPRDIDIVIPIPDHLFVHLYGDGFEDVRLKWPQQYWIADPPKIFIRWAVDCAKQSRHFTETCRRMVDFKTQPESLFQRYGTMPKIRLDS